MPNRIVAVDGREYIVPSPLMRIITEVLDQDTVMLLAPPTGAEEESISKEGE